MSTLDCLRKNNKCGLRLANKFAEREFFEIFITKENWVRTDEFGAIPILFPSKFLLKS